MGVTVSVYRLDSGGVAERNGDKWVGVSEPFLMRKEQSKTRPERTFSLISLTDVVVFAYFIYRLSLSLSL
jgi:hypothetical protein